MGTKNKLFAKKTCSDAGFRVKSVHVVELKMRMKQVFSFGHVRVRVIFILKMMFFLRGYVGVLLLI